MNTNDNNLNQDETAAAAPKKGALSKSSTPWKFLGAVLAVGFFGALATGHIHPSGDQNTNTGNSAAARQTAIVRTI